MSFPFDGANIFIWKVKDVISQNPSSVGGWYELAQSVKDWGFTAPWVKVADGTARYNQYWNGSAWVDKILPGVFNILKSAGIPSIGWQFIYGSNPEAEADRAIERIKALNLEGFIIDAEQHFKQSGYASRAERYMSRLRAEFPTLPLGLCSYRYPSYHPEFPWSSFLKYMENPRDYHIPQVYWEKDFSVSAGATQLAKSYKELQALKELPIVPAGPLYRVWSAYRYWYPTREQLQLFNSEALNLCDGVSWWAWDSQFNQYAETYSWDEEIKLINSDWGNVPEEELPDDVKLSILWREAGKHGWDLRE